MWYDTLEYAWTGRALHVHLMNVDLTGRLASQQTIQYSYFLNMPVVETARCGQEGTTSRPCIRRKAPHANRSSARPRFTNPSDSQVSSHHHCIHRNALSSSGNNALAKTTDETFAHRSFRRPIEAGLCSRMPRCSIRCSSFIFLVWTKEMLILSNFTLILCNNHQKAGPLSYRHYTFLR